MSSCSTHTGGSGRTLLMACVTEASGSVTETMRTLKFSISCSRIKNHPVKLLDPYTKLVMELREEIKKLQSENKILRDGGTVVINQVVSGSGQKGSGGHGASGSKTSGGTRKPAAKVKSIRDGDHNTNTGPGVKHGGNRRIVGNIGM